MCVQICANARLYGTSAVHIGTFALCFMQALIAREHQSGYTNAGDILFLASGDH